LTVDKITEAWRMTGTDRHIQLIASCLHLLDRFRLSTQMQILDHILAGVRSRAVAW